MTERLVTRCEGEHVCLRTGCIVDGLGCDHALSSPGEVDDCPSYCEECKKLDAWDFAEDDAMAEERESRVVDLRKNLPPDRHCEVWYGDEMLLSTPDYGYADGYTDGFDRALDIAQHARPADALRALDVEAVAKVVREHLAPTGLDDHGPISPGIARAIVAHFGAPAAEPLREREERVAVWYRRYEQRTDEMLAARADAESLRKALRVIQAKIKMGLADPTRWLQVVHEIEAIAAQNEEP